MPLPYSPYSPYSRTRDLVFVQPLANGKVAFYRSVTRDDGEVEFDQEPFLIILNTEMAHSWLGQNNYHRYGGSWHPSSLLGPYLRT